MAEIGNGQQFARKIKRPRGSLHRAERAAIRPLAQGTEPPHCSESCAKSTGGYRGCLQDGRLQLSEHCEALWNPLGNGRSDRSGRIATMRELTPNSEN